MLKTEIPEGAGIYGDRAIGSKNRRERQNHKGVLSSQVCKRRLARFKAAGEPSVKLVRPVRESMVAIIRVTCIVDRREVFGLAEGEVE